LITVFPTCSVPAVALPHLAKASTLNLHSYMHGT
jgi:hypothetical protein